MPNETTVFDALLATPFSAERTDLVAENLRLRHALTHALADYEMLNRVLGMFNLPFHPFTLTPQLIVEALGLVPDVEVMLGTPPPEMDSGATG